MTYTVIARDSASGQLGIGIATYSLAVGSYCPYIRHGIGAISTQASVFAAHGPALLDMIENGSGLPESFEQLAASDEHFEYRQIGAVASDGSAHVHTGSSTRDWAGSLSGEDWLVMGNALAGSHVVEAMSKALQSRPEQTLAERLVLTLEAGRDSGGQSGVGGRHLPERSAVVTVFEDTPFPLLDLRVDDHPDAVTELRRIFDRFTKVQDFYRDRATRPNTLPPQDEWMVEHGLE